MSKRLLSSVIATARSGFVMGCLFLLHTLELKAQPAPQRSISELNMLLRQSNPDSVRVRLLLQAALVYVLKPGMERNDFDSALYFVNQASTLSSRSAAAAWKARCNIVYSQLYRENNQRDQGKNYIASAINFLNKTNQREHLADAYIEMHHYYNVYSDSEWVTRVKYAELAEGLYSQSGNKFKQASVLKDLGDYYQIKEKDSLALIILHKSLTIFQSIKYQELEGVYDLIAYVLQNTGDLNQALKYHLMAVETAERLLTDSVELSTIYNRIGITYYRLARYQEASAYFTKAFSIAVLKKDTATAELTANSAYNAYLRIGAQQDLLVFLQKSKFIYNSKYIEERAIYLCTYTLAWLLSNDYKKAEPYAKELLQLTNGAKEVYMLRSLHRAIIPFYLSAGQYQEMYKYLPVNDSICQNLHVLSGLVDNYMWWYKADSALGNLTAAMFHYKLYKQASDSLLRFTASKQINELMIQFESLKKDQAIAAKETNILMLTNQGKLQQEQLRQTRVLKNLTFGLVALLLIIMALLFNRYRLKQRTNKKLELQQVEIAQQNLSLHHLVTEKEWLLKEIHHRVKNNLQIVMSLLNSQSAFIDNEPALTAIHDSQHRVHAMSLIHQKLYNAENLSTIEMSVYVRELVSYLADSFNTSEFLRFELNIEPLELDVSQAVPLGLILNEAITNAIKYAFPNKRKGVINIGLNRTTDDYYLLTIADDGIGIPPLSIHKKNGSLGMSLIVGLSEDLGGNALIKNHHGTTVEIRFVRERNAPRPDLATSSFVSTS